ncbi:MAG: hypothetical protein IPK19_14390 [Chloroflexi bacterium]|nr:hypothetical protein [Chloroflexota bacterium]
MRPSRLLFFGLIGLAVFALAGVLQAQDSGLGVEADGAAGLHDANNTQVGTVLFLDKEEYGTVALTA